MAMGRLVVVEAGHPTLDAGRPVTGQTGVPTRLATALGVEHGRISRVLRQPRRRRSLSVLGPLPTDEVRRRTITAE